MTIKSNRTIILVPHYLSVEVYADLALEIERFSSYKSRLLVLSDKDARTAVKNGMSENNVISYEKILNQGRLEKFGINELYEKYPNVPWGTVIAAERSFTDYSFTFGGVGNRSEKNDYVVLFLLRLIAFFDSEFEDIKPLAVVTVFGDNIYTHTASIVAEKMGIQFLLPHAAYLNEAGKPECGYLANTRFLESYSMVRNYLEYKSRDLTQAECERAESFCEVLRNYDASKVLELIYRNKSFENPITPNLKKIVSYVREHMELDSRIHFYKIDIWRKLRANFLRFVRYRKAVRFLKKQPETLPNRFVFYPMHFQPEASTLINGIWYANQLALIENLSKALPLGYQLVVKEHPRGRGMRPLWQYIHIASLFNVQFSDLASKIILRNAEAVVTISGSIGLEALAMKKPVIILGRTFHTFNSIYFRADSIEKLTHVLKTILLDKAFDKVVNLDTEIYKALLAYVTSLYEFFPFGNNRRSLIKVVLDEINKPNELASAWIKSQFADQE